MSLLHEKCPGRATLSEGLQPSRIEVIQANSNMLLNAARHLVAEGYAPLANPLDPNLNENDVFNMLCRDGYDSDHRSTTLIARDPFVPSSIAGTVRVVFGREENSSDSLPALDAMGLLNIEDDWPHRQEGISDNQVGELGRFAIPHNYRSDKGQITKALFDNALQVSRSHNLKMVYAIMPRYVQRILGSSGVQTIPVSGVSLKEENPIARELFDQFPKYWRYASPQLYKFNI